MACPRLGRRRSAGAGCGGWLDVGLDQKLQASGASIAIECPEVEIGMIARPGGSRRLEFWHNRADRINSAIAEN